jgi:hypothetical protein
MTQYGLGHAFQDLPLGDRGENLRRAIACHDSALRVFTEESFPQYWAWTQNYLGNEFQNLPTGDRVENLRRAIASYEAALRVFTEDRFPQEWANTQGNIGITYHDWASIENDEMNQARSIVHITNAIRGFRACNDEEGRINGEVMLDRWKKEWDLL